MADLRDQVADIASTLSNAEPGVFVTKKIAQGVEAGKGLATSALQSVKRGLTPKPPARDIELPKDTKPLGKPRSMNRRR